MAGFILRVGAGELWAEKGTKGEKNETGSRAVVSQYGSDQNYPACVRNANSLAIPTNQLPGERPRNECFKNYR